MTSFFELKSRVFLIKDEDQCFNVRTGTLQLKTLVDPKRMTCRESMFVKARNQFFDELLVCLVT